MQDHPLVEDSHLEAADESRDRSLTSPVRRSSTIILFSTLLVGLGFLLVMASVLSREAFVSRDSSNGAITALDIPAVIGGLMVILGVGTFLGSVRERRAATVAVPPFDRTGFSQTFVELSKNFNVLRRQTFIGFILAGSVMLMGAVVILAGAFGQAFGLGQQGVNLATISGIITEFFSGTSILYYKLSFDRLNVTSDRLLEASMVMSALARAEQLPGDRGAELTIELVRAMVRPATALGS
jgi:hypothetical protein